jgi:hypothetical protein
MLDRQVEIVKTLRATPVVLRALVKGVDGARSARRIRRSSVLDLRPPSTILGQLAIHWPSIRGIGHLSVDPTTYKLRTAMGANREYWPWKVTVTVSVGPLRCLARIRSASPLRGDSGS